MDAGAATTLLVLFDNTLLSTFNATVAVSNAFCESNTNHKTQKTNKTPAKQM